MNKGMKRWINEWVFISQKFSMPYTLLCAILALKLDSPYTRFTEALSDSVQTFLPSRYSVAYYNIHVLVPEGNYAIQTHTSIFAWNTPLLY